MAGNLTAMIAAIFSGSAVSTDPYFNYNTLLLSTTATNGQQNNTFLDSSTNNFTITRNPATGPNAPTQGTFSPFSQTGWGNYFNGSYLTVPAGADFNLGTNDFCIEFWLNPIAPATYGGILTFDDGDYPLNFSYASTNSSNLQANFGTNASVWLYSAFFDTSTATNAWAHYVATRSGSTFRLFKNGVLKATGTNSGVIGDSSSNLRINANGGSAGTTYISDLRIINGSIPTAYQTSSTTTGTTIFAVPTSPLTTTSQGATAADVKLLTCQSNRFVDNSTANPKTISVVTANSTPSTVPFSPFNPTSAWSASTVGGSGYFDGTGDYLTTPDNAAFNLGSSDFLIEAWVYNQSTTNFKMIMGQWNTGQVSYTLRQNASKWVFTYTTNGTTEVAVTGTSNQVLNAWTHLAVIRTGNTLGLFVNGTRETTASMTGVTIHNNTGVFSVGGAGNGGDLYVGYIGSSRLVLGTLPSGYDATQSTLTLPTAPFTSTASTSILLNFTNSGIYDATAKNVLETVGNAQVSTTTSQWPSTSMLFNGTTDYLQVNTASDLYNLVSGNWTIEAWVYRTSTATNKSGIITFLDNASPSLSGWAFDCGGSNAGQLGFYSYNLGTLGTNVSSSAGAVPINTWTYVAATCVGSTITIYINGTSVASGTKGGWSTNANCRLRIGGWNYSVALRYWQGYIQDPRITKGVARIITTPTAAFPLQGGSGVAIPPPSVEYLVVAGGGGGGEGGGGGGGYRTGTGYAVTAGVSISVTVGNGGTGTPSVAASPRGGNGGDSVFGTITSTGGGGGGNVVNSTDKNGANGGSGGGGSHFNGAGTGGTGNTPSTSPSQGNNGGGGNEPKGAGGGGGAGSAGVAATSTTGGDGGSGSTSSISGSSTTYSAGGGGGCSSPGTAGVGTAGVSGNGAVGNVNGTSGTANTGGGGGGTGTASPFTSDGGNGGSGVVIIRYADSYTPASSTTGSPTVTVAGGYIIYRWTGNGSITF